jgi:hypothetical protein
MLPQNKLTLKVTHPQVVTKQKGELGSGTPKYCSIPIIMFTGRAETPRERDISTSNKRPPIRIANATHSGLNQPYIHREKHQI